MLMEWCFSKGHFRTFDLGQEQTPHMTKVTAAQTRILWCLLVSAQCRAPFPITPLRQPFDNVFKSGFE